MKKNNHGAKRFVIALLEVAFYFGLIALAFMAAEYFGFVP